MGLERTSFTVSQDLGVVEVCSNVFEPIIECPIQFPFSVILSTADRTEGIAIIFSLFLCALLQWQP